MVYIYFYESIFQDYSYGFDISKHNNLKVIHDLYS